jgi:hypothetical protein
MIEETRRRSSAKNAKHNPKKQSREDANQDAARIAREETKD